MKWLKILLICLIVYQGIGTAALYADPPDPPFPPNPGPSPVENGMPVGAPVDRDVVVLILLGVGYALSKLISAKKQATRSTT